MLTIELDETEDGYTICRPVGELDAFTVSQFRQTLAELASSSRLLIDMSGVPFVDSAGLGCAHRRYPPGPGARRRRGRGLQPADADPSAAHDRL